MLVLDVPFGGGVVLSNRWFASGVGFGRSTFAAVSAYHIVGSPSVLVLDVILTDPQKALEFLFWLSRMGIMAFDFSWNSSLGRKRHENRKRTKKRDGNRIPESAKAPDI